MSLFDDTSWLKRMAEYEESSRKSKSESSSLILENNRKSAEHSSIRRVLNNNNVEAEKYKALYTQMLAKNNANIKEKKEFANDMQLPFKEIFKRRGELNNIKIGMEQLEDNLTTWIFQQKGARDVAIEFGTSLGKSVDDIDVMISERAVDSIENKLPIERGNNLNQSKNVFLIEPDHTGIVSDYNSRIDRVKQVLKAKIKK